MALNVLRAGGKWNIKACLWLGNLWQLKKDLPGIGVNGQHASVSKGYGCCSVWKGYPSQSVWDEAPPPLCFFSFHLKIPHAWIQAQHQTFFKCSFQIFSMKFEKRWSSHQLRAACPHDRKWNFINTRCWWKSITTQTLALKPSLKARNQKVVLEGAEYGPG